MARYPSRDVKITFGPGKLTPAVRAILYTNIGVYVLVLFAARFVHEMFGLTPNAVLAGRVWQIVTYLFVHDVDPFHILFNMLALWMFGVDLERRWGTRDFTKYYFVTGVGAGVAVVLASFLPFPAAAITRNIPTVGASGAIFGLMLAWAVLFPDRQVLLIMFPLPARVFVMIMGGIQLVYLIQAFSGVSAVAHLAGLAIGYLYLKGPKNLRLELEYRLTKWRMERMRRKFGVHRGGKNDGGWGPNIH